MKAKTYYVYIMASRSLNLYTEITNSLYRRVLQHKSGEIDGSQRDTTSTDWCITKSSTKSEMRSPARSRLNPGRELSDWRSFKTKESGGTWQKVGARKSSRSLGLARDDNVVGNVLSDGLLSLDNGRLGPCQQVAKLLISRSALPSISCPEQSQAA